MTNRLDEMVERAAEFMFTDANPRRRWRAMAKSSPLSANVYRERAETVLTQAGVPSLLEEVERLRAYDDEVREVLYAGLDRDRDQSTTRTLAIVATNALAREREARETAEAELQALRSGLSERIGELKAESRALPTLSHKGASIDFCVRQLERLLPAPSGEVQS